MVGYARAITIPGSPTTSYVEDDPETWVFDPVETGIASHHVLTMTAIQECIEKHSGRLMIFEPPGSAKSTYACVVGTTWAMGRFPGLRTLMVSSSGKPILRASKRARQVALSREYRNIWEEETFLPKGSTAADEWELTNGSGMFAAGILGGIVGSRADLGIIDDPVAGREEADSETMRNKIRQAYDDDFLTRLKPGASVILIQTRWHEDDLAGGLLPEDYDGRSGPVVCRDGRTWEVLCIPAEAGTDDPLGRESGEMLWPEWFDETHWSNYRANPRTWSALFQQDPRPQTGGQFEKEWFHRFSRVNMPKLEDMVLFGTGDWALTKKQVGTHPDYTVLGIWGMDKSGELWLFAGWHGRNDLTETLAQFYMLTKASGIQEFSSEGGVIRRAAEPMLKKLMEETKRWVSFTWFPAVADKIANASSFRARSQSGKIHVVNGPFGDFVVDQLCGFPFARYDDAVDMCGLAGRYIDKRYNPEGAEAAKKKRSPRPGTYEYLSYEDQDEKRRREAYER